MHEAGLAGRACLGRGFMGYSEVAWVLVKGQAPTRAAESRPRPQSGWELCR